jgi:hypothetical protein
VSNKYFGTLYLKGATIAGKLMNFPYTVLLIYQWELHTNKEQKIGQFPNINYNDMLISNQEFKTEVSHSQKSENENL